MKQIDIQKQLDGRGIKIDKVGISGFKMPIIIHDENNNIPTIGEFEIAVELPANVKGIHMSRFFEVIMQYEQKKVDCQTIEKILKQIKIKMGSQEVELKIEFIYFMTKQAPVSAINSTMNYKCKIFSKLDSKDKLNFLVEVNVPINSVCPCSKYISEEGAHNQRGLVSVKVKAKKLELAKLIREIEKSGGSQELYTLLKRQDEKYITEKMFDNPKFVEDIVRDVKIALAKSQHPIDSIKCINNESIHNHDAFAEITNDCVEE